MKQHAISRNPFLKALAALVCAVALGLGACCAVLYASAYSDYQDPNGFYHSGACWQVTSRKLYTFSSLRYLLEKKEAGGLDYAGQKRLDELTAELDFPSTNFRYVYRDAAGNVLLTNLTGDQDLSRVVYSVSMDEYSIEHPGYEAPDGTWVDGPIENYTLEYGVQFPLAKSDEYQEARVHYETVGTWLPYMLRIAIAGCALGILLLIYLLAVAGRRPGTDAVVLNWLDRIPYDLYLAVAVTAGTFCIAFGGDFANNYNWGWDYFWLGCFTAALLGASILAVATLSTTAARLKARTLLRGTVVWRLCAWAWKHLRRLGAWWRETFGSWDVTRRVIVGFLLYLLGTALTTCTIILIPVYQGAVLYGLCKWVKGWKAIREGTERIVSGQPDALIDTAELSRPICRDLKAHAEQLNDLGNAINSAVDERMKSERMKAELITNVSHDLKTPLTSIINYVDLLKKEDIDSEKAREYIEVLDRKSQRLKKLTEDLVEASKASTGALTVERERLGLVQLIGQALGEYSEKFAAARLTPVVSLPEEEVWVSADGRHLWRILDNLLGNCVKYAMPGTRLYLDLVLWNGNAVLSLKNVSDQPLNIPVDQLMERFVRGDESRTTEGSGLGLSIARSLTELQGGTFRLDVDGDLFKAVVTLPEVE